MTVAIASCPTCEQAVITTGTRCPWCRGHLTPPETVAYSVQRATEATYLLHLTVTKETA